MIESKPLTEWTPASLRGLIDKLQADRERYDRANRIVEARSCELEIAEATRALAIINRRATEAEDQLAGHGIPQMDVDAALALLRLRDLPDVHSLVADMWTALQAVQAPTLTEERMREAVRAALDGPDAPPRTQAWCDAVATRVAKELAGAAVSQEQREEDRSGIWREVYGLVADEFEVWITTLGFRGALGVSYTTIRDHIAGNVSHRLARRWTIDTAQREADRERLTGYLSAKQEECAELQAALKQSQAERWKLTDAREADLREAFLAGGKFVAECALRSPGDLDDAAAEYARSKAGG